MNKKINKRFFQQFREKHNLTRRQISKILDVTCQSILSYETWSQSSISTVPLYIFLKMYIYDLKNYNNVFFKNFNFEKALEETLSIKKIFAIKNKNANNK